MISISIETEGPQSMHPLHPLLVLGSTRPAEENALPVMVRRVLLLAMPPPEATQPLDLLPRIVNPHTRLLQILALRISPTIQVHQIPFPGLPRRTVDRLLSRLRGPLRHTVDRLVSQLRGPLRRMVGPLLSPPLERPLPTAAGPRLSRSPGLLLLTIRHMSLAPPPQFLPLVRLLRTLPAILRTSLEGHLQSLLMRLLMGGHPIGPHLLTLVRRPRMRLPKCTPQVTFWKVSGPVRHPRCRDPHLPSRPPPACQCLWLAGNSFLRQKHLRALLMQHSLTRLSQR